MKKKKDNASDAASLRQQAEERLKKQRAKTASVSSEADMQKLIHELGVHHIELEMQNEELVIAKEKAEIAEDKYTALYDFAPCGYLSLTKEGKITELNFAAAQMLGKERLHLIKNKFDLFISYNTRSVFNLFLQRVFASKVKQTCEVTIATKENAPIYVAISGVVSQNDETCLLTLIDITERKQVEDNLKESEIQYRNLADAGSALIWTSDLDKLCNYFNAPWLKFTGRTLEQEVGNGWTEGVHPDDFDRCLETYVTAFDKREPFEMEYRLRHSSSEYRWILDLAHQTSTARENLLDISDIASTSPSANVPR